MASVVTRAGSVLDLMADAVHADPSRIAVSDGATELTYSELAARAGRVATALRGHGVGAGALVALAMPRSAGMVVGGLGILRAGCAYVAIDPTYPPERIRWTLADAGVAAVVARRGSTPARLDGAPTVIDPDRPDAVPVDTTATEFTPSRAQRSDLAYIVYTSGSTGRPKGAMIEHASLSALIDWHRAAFALSDTDRCSQIASPGFDAAVWEIWPCLAAGASLHVVPDECRVDPVGLRDWLVAQRITVAFAPTAVAEGLIALQWPAESALRCLLTGGDALARRPPPGLPFALVNNYGVSEATVVATSGTVSAAGDGPPSIGRPIAGVLAEVVDERGDAVPPGTDGELVIGGAFVARGYLQRAELNAERFFEDARGRWYRTGDRMRETSDGELEFLGRVDDQLSIRGFRVEPAEIAAALRAHPSVAAAAVVAAADGQPVAGLVAEPGARVPDEAELATLLSTSLPAYMLPARYVWLDELPLTAHGKLDRDAVRALAEPEHVREPDAGVGTLEQEIATIVAELLERDTVAVDENFFLLGGHSLLGAQLIVRLDDRYGAEMPLRFLFDNPTPAQLAAEVRRQTAAGAVAR